MKKQISSHAEAAKAIRTELKKHFPGISFSVRSDSYSMGDSVRISWVDGPTSNMVEKITSKYQYGHFDGMQDLYEYSNSRNDIPQVKYVQESREISEEIKLQIFDWLRKTHNGFEELKDMYENSHSLLSKWSCWTASEYIYRITCKLDLTHGFVKENVA